MTETYQPPVRPMREVLPTILPEFNADVNYGLLATLEAFQRFGNHGFVTQDQTTGAYSFVSVPEQIAHSIGGPQPKAEAFTFAAEDTLVLADGTNVPCTQSALTEAMKAGTAKIEIVRVDSQGHESNFDIQLSALYGNKVLVAQILDTSEKRMAERLNEKIEQLNFLKQARIAIDTALTAELSAAHPSEKNFLANALNALRTVVDPASSSEIELYDSIPTQETANLILDKIVSTEDHPTRQLLPQEIAIRTREINNTQFPAVKSAMPDNLEGFKQVTAVASFPSEKQPDMQKIMAIFSRDPLSPAVADQLPYVMQEFKYALLKLNNAINIHEQLARKSAELKQAQLEARVDKLTSIPNRRWFVENVLGELSELERAMDADLEKPIEERRKDLQIGLIFGDIDKFGDFNKTHGHQSGDIVLTSVAQALYSNKRAEDFAARYGGEEFLITLPGISTEQAVAAAERHRKAISIKPFRFGDEPDQQSPITMSFGVVPMEVLVQHVTMDTVSDALFSKGFIKFVSEEQVEASKMNGNGNSENKIIQPDLIFDSNNARKSLHDLRLLIAFEYAHAIASKVNHSAKEAGRNRVFRAEFNDQSKLWEAVGTRTVINDDDTSEEVEVREPIDISGIKFSDLIIQGSLQNYLQALAPYTP